ncbi:bifunctional aminodeoxychorismate synthase component I/aminotransferase [Limnohabitans sp. 2KL-17]|uniref:chorismate-binding protein n=1 Tax=Limnohabitans sp. 2KL-17 TaxID=1100704 RepID=UPI000D3622EE|nr:chorismate-binding protein [Limnohabitans sp. 2KL-17]PUE48806.1 bifunctional aminodeoxychorismate synthase component I/aminotransferase [Limnohabitans sp. 2KL-17]
MPASSARIDFSDPYLPDGPRLRHVFSRPRQILAAHEAAQVRPVLDAVQAAAAQGFWCVGYLRYEAAPAFDAALAVHAAQGPLAWFAVYDEALPWPVDNNDTDSAQVQWQAACSRAVFDAALDSIHRAIVAGALYQVNFTAPLHGVLRGEPEGGAARALFAALQRAQPGGYAAFLDTGDEQLLSVSPELFFDWHDGCILTRPMKGTAPRGATPAEDAARALALRTSAKERAENVMIVDLLRNDLSRVAEPFSVQVPRLFHTEALPTVWQMTSDVVASTRAGCSLADVFAALFPCGSVTGAPKVSAMRMIQALEPEPRGVYCGAFGAVYPGENGMRATFNVPIRTVTLRGSTATCGIGSGITSGALAGAEWQEWRHKRAFVERASMPFELLETLALEDGLLRDTPAHLARMAAAAAHFAYPWSPQQAQQCLQQLVQTHAQGVWRVRLLLDARGQARAEAFVLPPSPQRVRLQLAGRALDDAHSEFVRFKTTRRAHYDAFMPAEEDIFDTLLWNAEGEITECTRGNIALLLDGRWLTPSLDCGLLGGIGRANALRAGRLSEGVVRLEDLPGVQAVAFVNSLRGWLDADLDPRRG